MMERKMKIKYRQERFIKILRMRFENVSSRIDR